MDIVIQGIPKCKWDSIHYNHMEHKVSFQLVALYCIFLKHVLWYLRHKEQMVLLYFRNQFLTSFISHVKYIQEDLHFLFNLKMQKQFIRSTSIRIHLFQ